MRIFTLCSFTAVALGCLTTSGLQAQETTSAGNLGMQASWTALKNLAEAANNRAGMALNKVQKIEECGNVQKVYGPTSAYKDANGCVDGGSSLPARAVVAFAQSNCPSGWSEYLPARGRFIRGIDATGSIDPSGHRSPGSVQDDLVRNHSHYMFSNMINAETGDLSASGYVAKTATKSGSTYQSYVLRPSVDAPTVGNTAPYGGTETRPKNVALLYCVKD